MAHGHERQWKRKGQKKHIWTRISDYLEHYYSKLESFYRKVLEFTLGYRKTVLVAA